MIRLSRLNGAEIVVNVEVVAYVERATDTVISFLNGDRILVKESVDELIDRVVAYKRRIYAGPPVVTVSDE